MTQRLLLISQVLLETLLAADLRVLNPEEPNPALYEYGSPEIDRISELVARHSSNPAKLQGILNEELRMYYARNGKYASRQPLENIVGETIVNGNDATNEKYGHMIAVPSGTCCLRSLLLVSLLAFAQSQTEVTPWVRTKYTQESSRALQVATTLAYVGGAVAVVGLTCAVAPPVCIGGFTWVAGAAGSAGTAAIATGSVGAVAAIAAPTTAVSLGGLALTGAGAVCTIIGETARRADINSILASDPDLTADQIAELTAMQWGTNTRRLLAITPAGGFSKIFKAGTIVANAATVYSRVVGAGKRILNGAHMMVKKARDNHLANVSANASSEKTKATRAALDNVYDAYQALQQETFSETAVHEFNDSLAEFNRADA
jgi:hypothetical protein